MSSFGGIFHVAREELNAFADGRSAAAQASSRTEAVVKYLAR